MNNILRHTFALGVALAWSVVSQAGPVLDHLPEDAIGFIAIRDVGGTSAKIERVTAIFQELLPTPLPAPLPLLKAATGLGAGLNEQGDALLALLGGGEQSWPPRPVLFVAVSDYAVFAESIDADATGEVCRVTIAGEEVLAAKSGSYAVLMNLENRDRMESLLSAQPKPQEYLQPFAEWLGKTDVAAVLMPAGVDLLAELGQTEIAGQRAQLEEQLSDPAMADMLKQFKDALAVNEALLDFFGAEIDAIALALSIDDRTNVRVSKRIAFKRRGLLEHTDEAPAADGSVLDGYADGPFVIAGGGPVLPGWADAGATAARTLMQRAPAYYGLQEYTEDDWRRLEQSYRDSMAGIRHASVVLRPGEKEDPLISNVFYLLETDDANVYLQSLRKSIEAQNELTARSTSDLKFYYELEETETAGKPSLLMTTDVAGVAADPNVAMVEAMMKAAVGEDGKLRINAVAADDETALVAIAAEQQVADAVKLAISGSGGIAESASIRETVKLLDERAPWKFLVSPQGTVAWISRWFDKFFSQFVGAVPTLPAYPDSPPLGITLDVGDGQLHADMVCPVQTLEGMAAFIKKSRDAE